MRDEATKKRPRAESPRRLRPNEQRCKRCGAVDGLEFRVAPKIWKAVAGPEWTNSDYDSVLCLRCFDQLADEKSVDYARFVESVCFVGQKVIMDFKVTRAHERPKWKRVR